MTNLVRHLTSGERGLAASIFSDGIDYDAVTLRRRKWFPFHPRHVAMAPCGHIHFHPKGDLWSDDFSATPIDLQGLFIHEMTHVWQAQRHGRWYLPLMRHPLCRYRYRLVPGRPFARYGLEQQAEIVRHAFLLRRGCTVRGAAPLAKLDRVLPFNPR